MDFYLYMCYYDSVWVKLFCFFFEREKGMSSHYLLNGNARVWGFALLFLCIIVAIWDGYVLANAVHRKYRLSILTCIISLLLSLFSIFQIVMVSSMIDTKIMFLYMPVSLFCIFISCVLIRQRESVSRLNKKPLTETQIKERKLAWTLQNVMTLVVCIVVWVGVCILTVQILNANGIYKIPL